MWPPLTFLIDMASHVEIKHNRRQWFKQVWVIYSLIRSFERLQIPAIMRKTSSICSTMSWWMYRAQNNGLYVVGRMLHTSWAQEVSNSRNKIHQTTYKDFFRALYSTCIWYPKGITTSGHVCSVLSESRLGLFFVPGATSCVSCVCPAAQGTKAKWRLLIPTTQHPQMYHIHLICGWIIPRVFTPHENL